MTDALPKLSFSHTALKDFENCPLAFHHKRVLRDVSFVQTEAAVFGVEAHKHFELRVTEGKPLPANYSDYESVLFDKIGGYKLEAERQYCLNDKLEETEWYAKDAWIRGVIDLLVWLDDETVWVVDFKTGKRRPDFGQLELFAAFVMHTNPKVKTVRASYLWINVKPPAIDTEIYTRDQLNGIWASVMTKIRRVYKAAEHDVWPARPSGLCSWCDVKKQLGCAHSRR